jgi:hypothetical protein
MNENIIINEDIERDVLKKLLDYCFSDNIKETVAYSVLNEIYDVSFQLPDDILMESINKVGFGMNKKLIPSCSYAKVNEVKKDNYKSYKDLSESKEPITLCCLNKKNCMYSYQDNQTKLSEYLDTNIKVESSVVFTTGGNFSYFHIDTYGSSRISIIPGWNLGIYKIWIFYCHEQIKGDFEFIRATFNKLKNTKDQIQYVLNNPSKFEFYLQSPSNKNALMHKGSHFHCVLTMYDKTISKYGACLSIGLRVIYEDSLTDWLRYSTPRIGEKNLLCSREQLIRASCLEIFMNRKIANEKIKSFMSHLRGDTLKRANHKAKKRKRKQIGKFLSEARKLAKLAHGIEEEEDHDQEEEEQKQKEAGEEKDTLDVCSSFNAQLHSDR